MPENQTKNNYFLSISIVVAAVLIAGALIYNAGSRDIASKIKIWRPQIIRLKKKPMIHRLVCRRLMMMRFWVIPARR